jgi:hypothetical protein
MADCVHDHYGDDDYYYQGYDNSYVNPAEYSPWAVAVNS